MKVSEMQEFLGFCCLLKQFDGVGTKNCSQSKMLKASIFTKIKKTVMEVSKMHESQWLYWKGWRKVTDFCTTFQMFFFHSNLSQKPGQLSKNASKVPHSLSL